MILDGKWLARQFHGIVKTRADLCKEKLGRPPGLAVILVGDNPASKAYVGTKEKVAKKCGFAAFQTLLPANASKEDLHVVISAYNENPEVDGILLQLPLPGDLLEAEFINAIDARKDADGLHPLNQGLLMKGIAELKPCTPLGVMHLLDLAFSGLEISKDLTLSKGLPRADLAGKRALVIGRSVLVGKPLQLMLLERNATVTLAHSKSPELSALCAEADVLVAAVGVPHLVKGDWIKKGAVVIDVGINRIEDGTLTGDVAFDEAKGRAKAITPVPGGVGPMTVAMLMLNTLRICEARQ